MRVSNLIMGIGVAGTWAVAALAIWGDRIRSRLFKPDLRVELMGLSGVLVPQNNGLNARYCHVQVKNARPRRFPPAHDVQLLIILLEMPDAAGEPYVKFAEMLPLWWVRQEISPLTRTVGPEALAALLFVREDGVLEFTPIVSPNHFPREHRGRSTLWVTLQARSTEADSKPIRYKIAWDGEWHPGEAEIRNHLTISPDPRRSN